MRFETALLLAGDAVRAARLRLRDDRAAKGGRGLGDGVDVTVDADVGVTVRVDRGGVCQAGCRGGS